MTPKEKTQELVDKFLNLEYGLIKEYLPIPLEYAKQCALIAVDEIILSRKDDIQFDDTLWACGSHMHPMYLKYWQEVKQEIEKL